MCTSRLNGNTAAIGKLVAGNEDHGYRRNAQTKTQQDEEVLGLHLNWFVSQTRVANA